MINFVDESASVFLLSNYSCVNLKYSELDMFTRFWRSCILCQSKCLIDAGKLSLNLNPNLRLTISNFTPCSLPSLCHWLGYNFLCHDLIKVLEIIT